MSQSPLEKGEALVIVGLSDGAAREGRVSKFSPYQPVLSLQANGNPGAEDHPTEESAVPMESVTYVGFVKDPDAPEAAVSREGLSQLKVHLEGGMSFAVQVAPQATHNPIGFYASPLEAQSPFDEIFFFSRAVKARENNEPLGAILIKDGVVQPQDVQRGLQAQVAEHSAPLGEILVEQQKAKPEDVEDAIRLQKRKRLRLGETLIEAGVVSQKDIDVALVEQRKRRGKKLGEVLVELGMVPEADLYLALAKKFHLPLVNLEEFPINPAAAKEIPKEMAEKYQILPLDTDPKTFTVATTDPLSGAHDILRFQLKKRIVEMLVLPSQLRRHLGQGTPNEPTLRRGGELQDINVIIKELEEGAEVRSDQAREEEAFKESDSAVVKLANKIILDGYIRGASDIHIEPNGLDRNTLVRFRIDGECIAYEEIPPPYRAALVARLKIMSDLDISERRKPQDGKIRLQLKDRKLELRVATLPTVDQNEDVVLRILGNSKPLPLEQLNFSPRNHQEVKRIISQPYGLVLVVGPTGSGKTTTLHSMLGAINTVETKIWTAEDPVEITQPGLRQMQVNPKIGVTFAAALRAFLRADPDVIMVGEMRDFETAETAIEASLTGHLVVSTLHTNTAPETITRLIDMGLDPFSFGDALLGIVAQRLARRLCTQCRTEYSGTQEEFQELAMAYGEANLAERGLSFGPAFKLWRSTGCRACAYTGYRSRLALHELLIVNDEIRRAVQHKAPVQDIRNMALASGMKTLLQDGVEKALQGLTNLKQVLAVCIR